MRKILILGIVLVTSLMLTACSKMDIVYFLYPQNDLKLLDAIRYHNIESAKEAIKDGANINKLGGLLHETSDHVKSEKNPYRIACFLGSLDVAKLLIEEGADPNWIDTYGKPIICYAVKTGKIDMVEQLLDHGADINASGKDGERALEAVFLNDRSIKNSLFLNEITMEEMYYYLISKGTYPTKETLQAAINGISGDGICERYSLVQKVAKDVATKEGETGLKPINEAIILGNSKEAVSYIEKEKELDPKTVCLVFAYGDSMVLDAIYKNGFDLNITDNLGNSLLGISASTGNMEALKRLVGTVDINKGTYNINPLEWAVWNDHLEAAGFLIKSGANVRVASYFDKDIMVGASRNGNIAMIKLLLDAGYPKEEYQKGLAIAAECGQLDVVKFFLDNGVDINGEFNGTSALYNASVRGELETVEYLVSRGAEVNTKSNYDSSLGIACFAGRFEIAKFLLEHGADPNGNMSEDPEGRPLAQAIKSGSFDIVKLLIAHGAVVDEDMLKVAKYKSTGIKEYLIQQLEEQTNSK